MKTIITIIKNLIFIVYLKKINRFSLKFKMFLLILILFFNKKSFSNPVSESFYHNSDFTDTIIPNNGLVKIDMNTETTNEFKKIYNIGFYLSHDKFSVYLSEEDNTKYRPINFTIYNYKNEKRFSSHFQKVKINNFPFLKILLSEPFLEGGFEIDCKTEPIHAKKIMGWTFTSNMDSYEDFKNGIIGKIGIAKSKDKLSAYNNLLKNSYLPPHGSPVINLENNKIIGVSVRLIYLHTVFSAPIPVFKNQCKMVE